MATPGLQFDTGILREGVYDAVRGLLEELGNPGASADLRPAAHLDRELGLGSLERVELMVRLERNFHVRLADAEIAAAETLGDVEAALAHALTGGARIAEDSFPRPTAAAPAPAQHTPARGVANATTWQEVLRQRARADAAAPHLIFEDHDAPEGARVHTVTFGELYERAQNVARELAHRGISPGQTVAIMLPTSLEFFYTFAGTLLAGAVPVPIYPPFRPDRIEEYAARQSAILKNAEVRLLVTFRAAHGVARLLAPRVPSLAGVVEAAQLVASHAADAPLDRGARPLATPQSRAEDLALLQYTSGSTGAPKGVMLTNANLLANVRAIGEAVAVREDDAIVSWLPLYHDMGLIGAWLFPLYYGLPLTVMPPMAFLTRPERWLRALDRARATLGVAPNFAFELCVRKIEDAALRGLNLSALRALLNGAEPIHAETLERFAARFAPYGFRREALLPVYGLAEASLAVTVPPLGRGPVVNRIRRDMFAAEGRAEPAGFTASPDDVVHSDVISFVSVGRALPGHEVKIVDAEGRELPERVEGDLWFRGPSATRGYFRNPQATLEILPAGAPRAGEFHWVNSGDRAYRAGDEIYITGRVKDIIIKAGRNLYPHEIEEAAARVAGVRKGCVVAFGVRDAGTERMIVAAETRERDAAQRAAMARAITEQVTEAVGLPPDAVELLAPGAIPKTSSGKLRREETKRLYLAEKIGQRLLPVWAQVARLGLRGAAGKSAALGRRAARAAYGVYAAAIFFVWLAPAWTLLQFTRGREQAARYTSPALRLLMRLWGVRIEVRGRENMRAPLVYVSNHASYFDVLALMAALGIDYRFVAKAQVVEMPLIGAFMRRLEHFSFDRNDASARLRQTEAMEDALRRGRSIFVFPEGTFTPHDGIRPFQLGAFKAAVATGTPICPVAMRGTRQFLRDETYLPRPARVTITICPPLDARAQASPESAWQEMVRLRDESRAIIAPLAGEPLL